MLSDGRYIIYQMMSTYISIIIVIEMYRNRQNYILRTVLIVFFNIDIQRSKGGFIFCEKIETLIICHLVFNKRNKRNMVDSDLKIVYNNNYCGLGFNNLGLKMSLWLEGTLEHPSF